MYIDFEGLTRSVSHNNGWQTQTHMPLIVMPLIAIWACLIANK